MSCCCINTLNLCNVPVCGVLEIKQAATAESGVGNVYSLVLDYFETAITLIALEVAGDNIKFDVSNLNENFQYTGQIFDSLGNLVSITKDSIDYDCIKFKTIISLYADSSTANRPPILNIAGTVVVESVVDESLTVTGTTELVTGITAASNTITSPAFIGVRVIVIRGNIPIPGIDPMDGSDYFTKLLLSDYITLFEPLKEGEFIRIQTIPQ